MTKGKGDNPGPWGRPTGGGNSGNQGGGNRPTGPKAPPPNQEDLDELIRRSQQRFKSSLPSFGSGKGLVLALLAFGLLWLASGIYKVEPEEEGVVLRFGKYHRTEEPGLRYHFPEPFEAVLKPEVTRVQSIQIGVQAPQPRSRNTNPLGAHADGRMLTGDNNVIIVPFSVQWKIKDAKEFLFNIRNPEETVKDAAESVMREVVSNHPLDAVLSTDKTAAIAATADAAAVDEVTIDKGVIELSNKVLLQKLLDSYRAGIKIERVQLTNVHVPDEVREAFDDVQAADQDRETTINQAAAYANEILPRARGDAEKMIQDSMAYKAEVTKRAEGDAARFVSIYNEYRLAKDVTKKRLYLETIESIMRDMDKVILDQKGGSGVLPYMALPEIGKRNNAAPKEVTP